MGGSTDSEVKCARCGELGHEASPPDRPAGDNCRRALKRDVAHLIEADNTRLVGDLASAKGEIVQLRQELAALLEAGDAASAVLEARRLRDVIRDLHDLLEDVRDVAHRHRGDGNNMAPAAPWGLGYIYGKLRDVPELEDLLGDAPQGAEEGE
jgi:hypothetical protein